MTPRADAPPRMDARLRTSITAVAVAGGVLAAAALVFFGPAVAPSVAAGAAIAVANLWALSRIVGALLPSGAAGARAQSRGAWGLLAALKMLGLMGAVWLLMRHAVVSALPMLVGFGSLPIGIAIGSLVSDTAGPLEED